ncbi:MAG: hypothetical protein WCR52_09260 [Bacteroidota bacterium]
MQHAKLIELLSHFSLKDLKRLKALADSPFFNTQEPIRALMEFILMYAPDFSNPKFNYKNAYKHVFGERNIKSDPKTAVAKVMSKLMDLVRHFIIQQELDQNPLQQSFYLIRFFKRNSMVQFIPKLLDDAGDLVDQDPYHDEYYFRYKMLLESEWASYLNMTQDKSKPDYNLNGQNEALDMYYALSKLQMYCFAKNEERRVFVDFDYSQMSQLLQWVEQTNLIQDFTIRTWYKALLLLNDPSIQNFRALKSAIHQNEMRLNPTNLRMLYSYLANNARVIFSNRQTYFSELFELYKEQIKLGTLHINGYLTPVMLRNITIVGLKQREFNWVEQFIHDNSDKIVPTYVEREDTVALCKAYLHFEKKEYQKTLDVIHTLRYESLFTKMDERRLRMMCYYEMDLKSPLEDLINSFRKFITDHKKRIPVNYLEENRLFIQFIYKLCSTNLKNRENRQALSDEIRQVPILPEKEWLLTKVEGDRD